MDLRNNKSPGSIFSDTRYTENEVDKVRCVVCGRWVSTYGTMVIEGVRNNRIHVCECHIHKDPIPIKASPSSSFA